MNKNEVFEQVKIEKNSLIFNEDDSKNIEKVEDIVDITIYKINNKNK